MADKGFWVTVTSKFFLIAALLCLLVVGYGVTKSAIRRAEIEREVQALRAEISEHQSKSEQLAKLIDYLGTEEYREKEARLQLGLQRPGEQVVVIPNLAEGEVDKEDTSSADSARPNWQRWWNYFLGLR